MLALARVGVGVERWNTGRSAENDRLLSSDGLQRLQAERRGGKGKTAVGRDPPAAGMAKTPEQLPQGSCETVRRRWSVAPGRPVADHEEDLPLTWPFQPQTQRTGSSVVTPDQQHPVSGGAGPEKPRHSGNSGRSEHPGMVMEFWDGALRHQRLVDSTQLRREAVVQRLSN